MTDKVVKFPGRSALGTPQTTPPRNNQSSFFSNWHHGGGHFVIFDVSNLDQEKLSNIVARNNVSSVFDFRSKPVFEKPLFSHKEIVSYFGRRKIPYYDAAYFERSLEPFTEVLNSNEFRESLSKGLVTGLVLVIISNSLVHGVNKENIRRIMRELATNVVEVNPSSILTY